MERHTLDVKGERLTWYEQGAGSVAVVFLHGIPTEPALWGSVVPLVHGARCLAFEMLGYADSIPEGDGRDISLAAQAARVVRWLDALDIDRAVLVGHDLGGGIAQIVAVEHTDRCAGLVLTNAVAYDSWPIPSVKAMRAAGTVLERTPARLFQPMLSAFVRIGHDDRAVGAESARLHWPPYTRHGGAQAFVRQIRSLRTEDTLAVTEGLTTIDVPARIVWSAADRFQKVRYGERLARDLRAPLTRLDGARHFVSEDHPQPLAAAVDEVVTMQGARR